jgi:hypothetical protein
VFREKSRTDLSLPSRLGIIFPTISVALAEERMTLPLVARPPRQSRLEGPSTVRCLAVVA